MQIKICNLYAHIGQTVNLKELINFKLANIVNLLAEGWRVGNKRFCNLSPQIAEYGTLLLIKKLGA